MIAQNKLMDPALLTTVLIVIIGSIFTAQMVNKPLSDWGNYYYGSHFLLEGKFNKDVYEPYKFNIMVRQQGETDIFLNYTPIPPFTALFYIPFQFTSSLNSKIIFCVLSILLFAVAVYRFTRFLGVNSYWVLAVPVILIMPLRGNIFFGQTYLLIIAMLMEGYISYQTDKKLLAGLLWGAAILLKLFPGIILLYLLFKKDYKMLGITFAIMAGLSVITAAGTGFGLNIEYFTHIMPRMLNNEINDTYAPSYQSALVLLNKIFVYDKLLNPGGTMNSPVLFKILNTLYSLTVLYICAMFTIKKNDGVNKFHDLLKFSLWILAGLMVTGYGSGYSLLLLIFIAIASVIHFREKKLLLIVILGSIFTISAFPVHWFFKYSLFFQFPRLYLFISFFVLTLIAFKIKHSLKYFYIVPILAVIIGYLNAPPLNNNDEYVFDKEEALLIYDYGELNGKLMIKFIDQNGRNEKELEHHAALNAGSGAEIKNNQLYYKGRQLTFTDDNKLNPQLNNNKEIYYLSDKNRGAGFYTLRKLKIPD
jgi:hypothetical protein